MLKQKIWENKLFLVSFSVIISLLAAELILRTTSSPCNLTKYGWIVAANTEYRKVVEDTPGELVTITVKHFENGFKRWGNINTEKVKMFIIGDSYTKMDFVSNGEEWYSFLEKEFKDLELFVYGAGGYGSLQEYMVLDDYIDKINPDLIVLQFSDNDFTNNLYDLDLLSYPYNNHSFKPYLEKGKIVYRLPLPLSKLRRHSFIAGKILQIYDTIKLKIALGDLEAYKKQRQSRGENAPKKEKERISQLGNAATQVTNNIMAMISKRAGAVPVYFLSMSRPLSPRIEKLCKKNNFIYIPGIAEYIIPREKNYCLRIVNDGHWNKLGNKFIGERLVEYFKEVGMAKK